MLPTERHRPFLTPPEEIETRIRLFQSELREKNIAAAWIDYPTDLLYFTGSIQTGVLLVPADGDPVYYAKKSLKRAETESSLTVEPYPGRKGLLNRIRETIENNDRLGLDFHVMPASTYTWLEGSLESIVFENIGMHLRLQRTVKSPWEIQQIEGAANQANTIFNEIENFIRPGITELELTGDIEGRLRAMGHAGTLRIHGVSDLVIITAVSGDSALYPNNFDGPSGGEAPNPSAPPGAGWKKLTEGETVIIDMVTTHNGYHSDQTRIFFLGSDIPAKVQKAHAFCLDVLSRLEKAMKPGANCETIYNDVQSWAETQGSPEGFMGYGENRVKFFGHGVGLELRSAARDRETEDGGRWKRRRDPRRRSVLRVRGEAGGVGVEAL